MSSPPHCSSLNWRTRVAILLTIFFWASAFVGIRVGLQGYTPGGLALFRYLIASICAVVLYLRLPPSNPVHWFDTMKMLFVGILGIGIYNVALNYGELTVPSGIASFIISQMPVFTTILAVVFLGERLTQLGIVGLLVSIAGVLLIAAGQIEAVHLNHGFFCILLAAIVGGMYSTVQKPLLYKSHALKVAAYSIWGGTLSLLFYFPSMVHEIIHASWKATLAVVYLGIFPGALGYLCWGYVLWQIPASRAASFLYLMPIIATILGLVCLGEVPNFLSLLGGVVALGGASLMNMKQKNPIRLTDAAVINNSPLASTATCQRVSASP